MAFFEYVAEDQVTTEVKEYMEKARRRGRAGQLAPIYYAIAKHPRLMKALVQSIDELIPIPNRFGAAQGIVAMLIAHASGCRPCFDANRELLLRLGYDEAALDNMCQAPGALPLTERERRFVEFVFRVARDPQGLKPVDLREMERNGFSKDEILEMIGVAAFWNLATTLSSAVEAGLREE